METKLQGLLAKLDWGQGDVPHVLEGILDDAVLVAEEEVNRLHIVEAACSRWRQAFQVNNVAKPADIVRCLKRPPTEQPHDYDHSQRGTSVRSVLAACP